MSVHGAIFFPFLFVFEGFQRARFDYFWQYYFLGKEFSVLLSAWVPKVFMRAFSMWSAEALATLSIGIIMKFIAEAR